MVSGKIGFQSETEFYQYLRKILREKGYVNAGMYPMHSFIWILTKMIKKNFLTNFNLGEIKWHIFFVLLFQKERQLYHVESVGRFSRTRCPYINTSSSLVTTQGQTLDTTRTSLVMTWKGETFFLISVVRIYNMCHHLRIKETNCERVVVVVWAKVRKAPCSRGCRVRLKIQRSGVWIPWGVKFSLDLHKETQEVVMER